MTAELDPRQPAFTYCPDCGEAVDLTTGEPGTHIVVPAHDRLPDSAECRCPGYDCTCMWFPCPGADERAARIAWSVPNGTWPPRRPVTTSGNYRWGERLTEADVEGQR